MGYNNGLLTGNNGRIEDKEQNIDEALLIIKKSWKPGIPENKEKYGNSKFEETANILKEEGFVSGKKDLGKKIFELNEKGYSFDQIGLALHKFVQEINPTEDVKIHKQSIARVIETYRDSILIVIDN
ncbi:MAG: hypothetical protein QM490_06090 [Candidatus Gracilibacteria bacterium]